MIVNSGGGGRLPHGRAGWRARSLVLLFACIPAYYILTTDPRVPTQVRVEAALLWLLCYFPAWSYFSKPRERRPPLPFLPIVGAMFGVYFALPIIAPVGFLPAGNLLINASTEYAAPVRAALLGWATLMLSYFLVGKVFPERAPRAHDGWHPVLMRRWSFFLLYGGLVMEIVRRELPVPAPLRAILFFSAALAWLGAAVLVVLAVQGKLSRPQVVALGLAVLAGITIQMTGGLASYVAIWIGIVYLSIWIARGYLGRKATTSLVVAAMLLLSVRAVIQEFRDIAWFTQSMTFSQRIELVYTLVGLQLESEGLVDSAVAGWQRSGRWGTIDILSHVVRETPERIPHWNGETYYSLIGAAVPRIIWPSKPTKMLGQEFGHRYRILHVNDQVTSINLPYFIEFYANFGMTGIIFGMGVVGAIYRILQRLVNVPGESPLHSIVGMIILFPLFNIESDFSLTFGGLLLNGGAIYVVLRFLNRQGALARWRDAVAIESLRRGHSRMRQVPVAR